MQKSKRRAFFSIGEWFEMYGFSKTIMKIHFFKMSHSVAQKRNIYKSLIHPGKSIKNKNNKEQT